ncbi:hypothetical protein Nepgr_028868 [Nepenthes gracilis]|uniref:Uncharacterized protein n=1 Tax=Nepenthes gracilis TaxID=150966 RepID=A0AAD3TCH8_NEPGR|nr:hypothetical protein Nepgr_028868 [Nepenthes gracilis]
MGLLLPMLLSKGDSDQAYQIRNDCFPNNSDASTHMEFPLAYEYLVPKSTGWLKSYITIYEIAFNNSPSLVTSSPSMFRGLFAVDVQHSLKMNSNSLLSFRFSNQVKRASQYFSKIECFSSLDQKFVLGTRIHLWKSELIPH